jgi:CHAD domain-containing protein
MAQRIVAAGHMKVDPSQTAAENARSLLPKMARRYFEAGRKALHHKTPPDDLHSFRLETKRFRYSLELFRPLYGPTIERYLSKLRELQGALGKVSDYQAIQRVLVGDRKLKSEIENALRGKLKGLRQTWRTFDSDGQLRRWRTYLGREPASPRAKRTKRAAGAPLRIAAARKRPIR